MVCVHLTVYSVVAGVFGYKSECIHYHSTKLLLFTSHPVYNKQYIYYAQCSYHKHLNLDLKSTVYIYIYSPWH